MDIISVTSPESYEHLAIDVLIWRYLTCKSICREMHHLPLQSNVINFWTGCSQDQPLKPRQFESCFTFIDQAKSAMLRSAYEPVFQSYMTPHVVDRVAREYPEFYELLHRLRDGEG